MEKLFEIRFQARAEHLCDIRAKVKHTAEVAGCCKELYDKLVIAVNEACINIIKHDYCDIRPGGLGTHFINEIMDECDRGHLEEGKGNYLEMIKKIS